MAGRFKGFCHFPCFQTLPPSRAPQARGEACVTVFERRSHLGPPAEGRQGPSDDYDDDDGDGIHPEYQWRIYLLVNPPLVYPPGHHHHHHVGEKIQARVSVQVYLKLAKIRHKD